MNGVSDIQQKIDFALLVPETTEACSKTRISAAQKAPYATKGCISNLGLSDVNECDSIGLVKYREGLIIA